MKLYSLEFFFRFVFVLFCYSLVQLFKHLYCKRRRWARCKPLSTVSFYPLIPVVWETAKHFNDEWKIHRLLHISMAQPFAVELHFDKTRSTVFQVLRRFYNRLCWRCPLNGFLVLFQHNRLKVNQSRSRQHLAVRNIQPTKPHPSINTTNFQQYLNTTGKYTGWLNIFLLLRKPSDCGQNHNYNMLQYSYEVFLRWFELRRVLLWETRVLNIQTRCEKRENSVNLRLYITCEIVLSYK